MRGQQIHHSRGGLHRVIKIMKGSVTWKKSGISSMKEIKRENNQSLRQVSGAFPENVSHNAVCKFRRCVKTLGMEHFFGVIHECTG
jgi:hypothetical protein